VDRERPVLVFLVNGGEETFPLQFRRIRLVVETFEIAQEALNPGVTQDSADNFGPSSNEPKSLPQNKVYYLKCLT
jgi:hypothetical protein